MTKETREPCNDKSGKGDGVIASPDLSGRGNLMKETVVDIWQLR
jgi:hypothetical protein